MTRLILVVVLLGHFQVTTSQIDSSRLTLERIFKSTEFAQENLPPYQWIQKGEAYLMTETNMQNGKTDIIHYETATGHRTIFASGDDLIDTESGNSIDIESFTLSDDESKILIFTNSKRVWRSNTKGDYWVLDRVTKKLRRLGVGLPTGSLMFAKFRSDNTELAYVSGFNLYKENFSTGQITALTTDGTSDIINGTFDWVYEEEFGCRDGFRWSPDGRYISYWQLDASKIGTFYMINSTDSIYSQPIPVQYPKVGQDPSSCKIGLLNLKNGQTEWIAIEGDPVQHYLPRMQWITNDLLLILQINRKQNHLIYWTYNPNTKTIKKIYEEHQDTWIDIDYPDVASNTWGMYDLSVIDGNSVTRMNENGDWRHVYKINLLNGQKTNLSPHAFDVAATYGNDANQLYFAASPFNSTQRYLYKASLDGSGKYERLTPANYSGINTYDMSPNGRYAFHTHSNVHTPRSIHLIRTADHQLIRTYVKNAAYSQKIAQLELGDIRFFSVKTNDDIDIDGRMLLPPNFDSTRSYPVLFHVYGEPWGQVALDRWGSLWDLYMAQQGYIIIDMDNRGTPCLKGSQWRKSIYRKIGVLNTADQAAAASEVLKWPFIDRKRTAVWGWSGGGSMTLNLMFKHADIYTTGVSIAPVGNQLLYDNIYQERYMGLPQENVDDFINGSPLTHAHGLKGNLLLIHGTGDDNVHYQNAEIIINELIKQNIPFDMMSYPNRSHGIYEGKNTTIHLYSLISRYIKEHVPTTGER